ncbi:exodeoxyribonuclease VII small subunit [Undibacterium squillarum]|uniref:Exodeoxyribonuclease 7 small subunit n=1 Tax=Undibacterium squillarum TaxID=1131567 RepID=A0ABQ2Y0C5_9BURK|nr:exodeoxyribonuclease VII small subunit [Undibacterium squillarum]GGX41260.1 exodeoxyribonuclease 7 small subunit [Undibacterium squillarum]
MPRKQTESPVAATQDLPASFESAMAELQQLVEQMESGSLALEASVAAYQRGAVLIRYCSGQLEQTEQQVRVLENGLLRPLTISPREDLE